MVLCITINAELISKHCISSCSSITKHLCSSKTATFPGSLPPHQLYPLPHRRRIHHSKECKCCLMWEYLGLSIGLDECVYVKFIICLSWNNVAAFATDHLRNLMGLNRKKLLSNVACFQHHRGLIDRLVLYDSDSPANVLQLYQSETTTAGIQSKNLKTVQAKQH